ncbi:hypothetical protein N7495_004874 [Penicillium taxi]|uniref:uncharacterized protein n=1 Tax=Penicillium taxi TaxID=168475 RepID=UPI0025453106|nr:uncharacterized protein N7495_004874 [Penicillium taxi]KAJ5900130.1 hypothetical protein N7495_004874 [Penicillium taxi]
MLRLAYRWNLQISTLIMGYRDWTRRPELPPTMKWEQLSREGLIAAHYSFQTMFGDHPRKFTWKRTSGLGQRHRDYKLVDEDTQVIALFSSDGPFTLTKTGQLDIYVECGSQFALLVLITALGLHEKIWRTNWVRSGGARSGILIGVIGNGVI